MNNNIALVVDDDDDLRALLTFKLLHSGFEVHGAPDGTSGLAAIVDLRPAIVLLDWMMPTMTGLEVCAQLREVPAVAATPVILLTAKAQELDIERGFAAGADDYIVKPFSPRADDTGPGRPRPSGTFTVDLAPLLTVVLAGLTLAVVGLAGASAIRRTSRVTATRRYEARLAAVRPRLLGALAAATQPSGSCSNPGSCRVPRTSRRPRRSSAAS